jgi:hypothetical protein
MHTGPASDLVPHPRWAGCKPEVPAEGLEQEVAAVAVASGGALAEQEPPPGKSEPGMEAGEGAPAGWSPWAVGPEPVSGLVVGPLEAAGETRGS